ncbi:G2/mitotic-specific cyclin S13-7-like isoform X1 [Durio zibethinus]|uniref:G2/mitotic-specific cyclin S13-7-like isoform X1 n=1 Tax=Durio zibethinus TaxID=66656 RepID=A0A6P5ZIR2_DURZI|nr:G2/mitotic-specific cyclin S13-7-like isoform X1 [Durio zibethinus]
MASEAIVPQQKNNEVKPKNIIADGRNRRVLQDIGNFVKERGAQGKKPITKGVANVAQSVKGGGGAVTKEVATQRKVVDKVDKDKPKPETLIVMSSDEKTRKTGHVSRREGSSRKEVKTLTSILSARRKAACGLTNKPKDSIEDIDGADVGNELAVAEYVDDIYKFYKFSEDEGQARDYMDLQPDINAKMRSILVDWLIEVHCKFDLMPETLYLTMNIVDRFLSVKVVPRKELQLVGISAMLIACKYEEIWAPKVNDFVFISDNAYAREQVLVMEKAILDKLEWYLTVPTAYVFLVRFIKASILSDDKMEDLVFFLAELGLMQYPTVVLYCPSMLAAAAVYAARCTLDKSPHWSETLKHHTGYTEDQLTNCAKLLVKFHSTAAESKLKAIHRKFSSPDRSAVALLSPAKSLLPNHGELF